MKKFKEKCAILCKELVGIFINNRYKCKYKYAR